MNPCRGPRTDKGMVGDSHVIAVQSRRLGKPEVLRGSLRVHTFDTKMGMNNTHALL